MEEKLHIMFKTIPIKNNHEFMRVYKKGKFYVGRYITLYILANRLSDKRIGITASKKVGNAVKRNRIRRLVKENYRAYEDFCKGGVDFVFVARVTEVIPSYIDIKKEMKFLLKKLNVFDQEKWDCLKQP